MSQALFRGGASSDGTDSRTGLLTGQQLGPIERQWEAIDSGRLLVRSATNGHHAPPNAPITDVATNGSTGSVGYNRLAKSGGLRSRRVAPPCITLELVTPDNKLFFTEDNANITNLEQRIKVVKKLQQEAHMQGHKDFYIRRKVETPTAAAASVLSVRIDKAESVSTPNAAENKAAADVNAMESGRRGIYVNNGQVTNLLGEDNSDSEIRLLRFLSRRDELYRNQPESA